MTTLWEIAQTIRAEESVAGERGNHSGMLTKPARMETRYPTDTNGSPLKSIGADTAHEFRPGQLPGFIPRSPGKYFA